MSQSLFNSLAIADFKKATTDQPKVVVVKIHASFCGPCKMMAPALELMAAKHDGMQFFEIQADGAPENLPFVKTTLGVTAVPTFLVFEPGKVVVRFSGATANQPLAAHLNTLG